MPFGRLKTVLNIGRANWVETKNPGLKIDGILDPPSIASCFYYCSMLVWACLIKNESCSAILQRYGNKPIFDRFDQCGFNIDFFQ